MLVFVFEIVTVDGFSRVIATTTMGKYFSSGIEFSGKHAKYVKNVRMTKGKVVEVTFDKPTALQIDGETITDVLSYKVEV